MTRYYSRHKAFFKTSRKPWTEPSSPIGPWRTGKTTAPSSYIALGATCLSQSIVSLVIRRSSLTWSLAKFLRFNKVTWLADEESLDCETVVVDRTHDTLSWKNRDFTLCHYVHRIKRIIVCFILFVPILIEYSFFSISYCFFLKLEPDTGLQ